MAYQNTTIHTGDSVKITVNAVDCAGNPVDMTGATIAYSIRTRPTVATATLTKATGGSGVVIAEDVITITLLAAETDLDGWYFHELVATDILGHVETGFTGGVTFSPKVVTSCDDPLTAVFDTDIFTTGIYSFDFSQATNSFNLALLSQEVL